MAEIEEEAIRRALDEVDGNRRLAAERLGIGLRTLYEKLKRYGISWISQGQGSLGPWGPGRGARRVAVMARSRYTRIPWVARA